jgi:hypothetical protein
MSRLNVSELSSVFEQEESEYQLPVNREKKKSGIMKKNLRDSEKKDHRKNSRQEAMRRSAEEKWGEV